MENCFAMENASAGDTEPLDERSRHLRRLVLRSLQSARKGHVGPSFSLIEILRCLYDSFVRHDPKTPDRADRDRVILSKGHGCLALYAVLADRGYFPPSQLEQFCARHSPLGGHPERAISMGIEATTGALGHGLPIAAGVALAHKRRADGVRIFVIVGDGELNEGSNWEAMLLASKYQLNNLVLVVDRNGQQCYGNTETVMPLGPLTEKIQAFGFCATEADGHSLASLHRAFERATRNGTTTPQAVICRTVKGKGLRVAEHDPAWHYRHEIDEHDVRSIQADLGETSTFRGA